jgi:signal transduction histidine kinase
MSDWRALVARWRWEAALAVCIVVSLGALILSETGHQRLSTGYALALQSMWAAASLGELQAVVVDAETGQRGFLLTRNSSHLDPYILALKRISTLQAELRTHYLQRDTPAFDRFGQIGSEIRAHLDEMDFTIRLAREGKEALLLELISTDAGRARMAQIRQALGELQGMERERAAVLVEDWKESLAISRVGVAAITALNIVLLVLTLRWLKQHWQRGEERAGELDRLVGERTEQLARLSAYLQQVSENEKTHLSRELHDELGAILTATRMDLLWVRARMTSDQAQLLEKLKRAMDNLDQGIAVGRRIIEDLRPSILSNFGLMTAVRAISEQTAERMGWQLQLDLPASDPELDDDVEIAMFRVLQESLSNAAKYAKASQARVRLQCLEGERGYCRLEIEDNGVGFRSRDVQPHAHGLAGMRQRLEPRGGSLVIRSEPGKGTLVQAFLPFGHLSEPAKA